MIYLDATDLIISIREGRDTPLGIRRVIAKIIECSEHHGNAEVKIACYDEALGRFLISDLGLFLENLKRRPMHATPEGAMPRVLRKYASRPYKFRLKTAELRLRAALGDARYFRKRGTTIPDFRFRLANLERNVNAWQPAQMAPGDTLVLFHVFDGSKTLLKHLSALRSQGVHVIQMIHDLIAYARPDLFSGPMSKAFNRFLQNSTDYASAYVCVSDASRSDMLSYLAKQGHDTPCVTVRMAQQLKSDSKGGADSDPVLPQDVQALIDGPRPFVLSVGSIEPRKNHLRLMEAWNQLANRVPQDRLPTLVVAGQIGWLADDVIDKFSSLPFVTFLQGPSDEVLAALYKNCRFTAYVSLHEGWGLPVGESLSLGKICLTSRNSSLPEVGGDLAEYCNATSVESIANAAERLITDDAYLAAKEARLLATPLRSWQEVADELIQVTRDMTSPQGILQNVDTIDPGITRAIRETA